MSSDFLPDRERRFSRREIITGLAMASAGALVAARKPNVEIDYLGKHKLDKVVPTKIGSWKFVSSSGLVVPPTDQLALALYSQTLTRVYADAQGNPIMLLIAYSASQTGFLQVHRPEFCYTAAGYSLSDFQKHQIALGPSKSFRVNSLLATRDASQERLLYWTRIGNHIPLSWAEQKLVFAEDNLRRLIPDAALVRVSTTIQDQAQAMAAMDGFIQAMVASVAPPLRRVLVV